MDIATGPLVERIARVLAGERLSANGHGDQESAGSAVDAAWPDYRDAAVAVLHTLRAQAPRWPPPATRQSGNVWSWPRSRNRSRRRCDSYIVPGKAGIDKRSASRDSHRQRLWIPASAGMTVV